MVTNFLFTCVGRRVALVDAFRRYVAESGSIVVTADTSNLAPAGILSDRHYPAPRYDDPQYIPFLLDICRREQIAALIPLMEPEFPILDQNRESFNAEGTVLVLSSSDVINICKDKYETYRFFQRNNIPGPDTFLPDDCRLHKAKFPLFIKPRTGMGSAGTFKVNSERELEFFIHYVPDPIIQEYIEGTEYTMDVLNDLEGHTVAVVPRERIEVRAGEVSKSQTVKDWELINKTKEVAEKLGGIGPLTVQAFRKPGGDILFTEINPRFGGGVPLAIKAGLNYPALLAQMIAGKKVNSILGEFKDNLLMLRYDEALYLEDAGNMSADKGEEQ